MNAWIPFLQSLIWPIFIGLLLVFFRGWFRELLDAIKKRIESGSEMSVGPQGFTLGSAPKLEEPKGESTPATQVLKRFDEESKKIVSQKETTLDMSKYFQLVHSANLSPESSKRQGRPYYTIQVWLEANSPELMQRVSKVVYHLHPTFPNPDREINDPKGGFELITAGWGQFNLSADVYFDDNSKPLRLFRYINFGKYPLTSSIGVKYDVGGRYG
jgi:hypothetical protein